jgi:hypothetical protein
MGTLAQKSGMPEAYAKGNPLSSMMFLLVMEALIALIRKAGEWSLFQQL